MDISGDENPARVNDPCMRQVLLAVTVTGSRIFRETSILAMMFCAFVSFFRFGSWGLRIRCWPDAGLVRFLSW